MSRIDELLVSTARGLKEGKAPLNEQWLIDHAVTFEECMDVADALATAIHVYRAAISLGLELTRIKGEERSLAGIVKAMSIQQGGPHAVLAEAVRLMEKGG